MQIVVTKGSQADWVEARREDGSVARESVPHKGPVAHDLVHYAVETEFGIAQGFWGLVAAGNAPEQIAEMAKAAGHASAKRAEKPQAHFVEAIQVERIVEAFEAELWSRGTDNAALRAMAEAGCAQSLVPSPEMRNEVIERTRARLAGLAEQWAALPIGGSLTLDWMERNQAAA
jgi:hypothetical protein